MKVYMILFFIINCTGNDFKVGDCIQNPDSIIVWKIKSIENGQYTLFQSKDKRIPNLQTIKLDGIWTKSNCPNF